MVQYGDHIYLSDDGVMYENWLLQAVRAARPVDAVGGHRSRCARSSSKVLILFSRDGRRMLVDAILGYAIARDEILRRAPQAIFSGTLAPEDS